MDVSRRVENRQAFVADPDAALVKAARKGDRSAAGRLFDMHIGSVRFHLYRITGATQELDDLSQRVFLETWRSLPRFRGEAAFSTWITRITIQVALTYLREQKRRPPPVLLSVDPADDAPSPRRSASTRQLFDLLHSTLDSMRPKHRVVILLHLVLGYTVHEISALTGDTQRAVRGQLLRAKKSLTTSIGKNTQLSSWLDEGLATEDSP